MPKAEKSCPPLRVAPLPGMRGVVFYLLILVLCVCMHVCCVCVCTCADLWGGYRRPFQISEYLKIMIMTHFWFHGHKSEVGRNSYSDPGDHVTTFLTPLQRLAAVPKLPETLRTAALQDLKREPVHLKILTY